MDVVLEGRLVSLLLRSLTLFNDRADKLDNIAKALSNRYILRSDLANSFVTYLVKLDIHPKSELAQDHHLVCSIDSFNVVGWITFSVTKTLRFC